MARIRWEGALGYLGNILICDTKQKAFFDYDGYVSYELDFYLWHDTAESYTRLSSAKRGAERLLDKFLRDAGLEVKGD